MAWGAAPESATIAMEWLDRHQRRFGHFINGEWTAPSDTFAVINPATAKELAQVTQGSDADVDAAVAAARAALPGWRGLGGHGRARWLYAIARGMQRNSRLFSVVESLDNGKPIRESRDIDIPLVARHFYHHAGWAQLLDREFPGMEGGGRGGAGDPVELPAADAGVEDRARDRGREHRGAQAGGVHAAHRALLSRNCSRRSGCRRAW